MLWDISRDTISAIMVYNLDQVGACSWIKISYYLVQASSILVYVSVSESC